jgi:hypothetical protein
MQASSASPGRSDHQGSRIAGRLGPWADGAVAVKRGEVISSRKAVVTVLRAEGLPLSGRSGLSNLCVELRMGAEIRRSR